MTKNLSKSPRNKINGQRLPPIPITDEASNFHSGQTKSILKNSQQEKPEYVPSDEEDLDSSRVPFCKTQADVLLLLDTYPPKTWTATKNLQGNQHLILNQQSFFDPTTLTAINPESNLVEKFPGPLSDRLPSSRYCRRSLSSACSRRSSILFPRQSTTIPVDATTIRREDTFDTLSESHPDTSRTVYQTLPPISAENQSAVSKSLNIEQNNSKAGLSPPLITTDEALAVKKKKEEFTQRLLSKNLRRETSSLVNEKSMIESPIIVQKTVLSRQNPTIRPQQATVEKSRFSSVDRNPGPLSSRSKISIAEQTRSSRVNFEAAQPSTKSLAVSQQTMKRSNSNVQKPKNSNKPVSTKSKTPTTALDPSTHDVTNPLLTVSTDVARGISNTPTVENIPISIPTESAVIQENVEKPKDETKEETSRVQTAARKSIRYPNQCSRPVPKPLTLQGEKDVDPDYPRTTPRPTPSLITCSTRQLKGQPLITELFADTVVETSSSLAEKPDEKSSAKPIMKNESVHVKKQPRKVVKNVTTKKSIPTTGKKHRKPAPSAKAVVQTPMTESEIIDSNEQTKLIITGPNWTLQLSPKVSPDEKEPLLVGVEDDAPPIVEDEDLPYCESPTDMLNESQTTVMTTALDIVEMNNLESSQALEITPILNPNVFNVPVAPDVEPLINTTHQHDSLKNTSGIRNIYETVQDSVRKDTSLVSLRSRSLDDENNTKTSLTIFNTHNSNSSKEKTLPFQASFSNSHLSNRTLSDYIKGSPLRVVEDSLNSQGSGTHHSTSSQEDHHDTYHQWLESDCEEVYRTARKGKRIGRGAYGTVWSYMTYDGRVIAVKEIELDQESDSQSVRDDYQSVKEEVHILRALNHPNIVKFLGTTCHEDIRMIKIFMEYLPNGTIESLLTSFGPFHNDTLKKYTLQIVQGVSYLHDNSVVHRDIKGKNVMLDSDGNIKLIDFGCAKRLKQNQNTHTMHQILRSMKGTANWMAPEVIAETGHGKKADIWSIGCTLCEMATGKPPWSSEHNHLAVLLIIVNGTKPPADLPDTCPKSGQDFFRLCLTRDPTIRPSARDLLSHPFLTS